MASRRRAEIKGINPLGICRMWHTLLTDAGALDEGQSIEDWRRRRKMAAEATSG